MNKPFFIGNPIIDNYLKTPAGQEELKTAIEKTVEWSKEYLNGARTYFNRKTIYANSKYFLMYRREDCV